MRPLLAILVLLGSLAMASAADTTGRVIKVLPLFLDQQGQDSPTPSLYDRDAYQARLRQHDTNNITGIRVDVQWKVSHADEAKYTVRAELRGVGAAGAPHVKVLTAEVKPGYFSKWTSFTVAGQEYKDFGSLVAWHATLWQGDRMIGEEKSFLW